jgi:4'-phosphopantetheinyl transferase
MMAPTATTIRLQRDEVHVWMAPIEARRACLEGLAAVLDADERRRADGFCFESDRRRFVVSRALLRLLLARYVGVEPHALAFRYGPAGKPEMVRPPGSADLRFNASRTRGLALYAITLGRRIGVDVEARRPLPEFDRLVRTCLSPREQAALGALQVARRQEAFFDAWTRKEAFVKATGEGLWFPPERVEVSMAPGEPAELRCVDGSHEAAAAWGLWTPPTGPGYAAAVAVEGHSLHITCRQIVTE